MARALAGAGARIAGVDVDAAGLDRLASGSPRRNPTASAAVASSHATGTAACRRRKRLRVRAPRLPGLHSHKPRRLRADMRC